MIIYHTVKTNDGVPPTNAARLTAWAVECSDPVTIITSRQKANAKSFSEVMKLSLHRGEKIKLQVGDTTNESSVQTLTSILRTYF